MRAIIPALLLTLAAPAFGQTLTEQLQKGIYTEETLRDLPAAGRIYRQIGAAPTVPETIAREAARRLTALGARQTLGQIKADTDRLAQAAEPLATVDGSRYRHRATGIQFDAPAGWEVSATFPSSDNGEMVTLRDTATGMSIAAWMIREQESLESTAARLDMAPTQKVHQRLGTYGIAGAHNETYRIPPESIRKVLINGRPAIAATAQYTQRGHIKQSRPLLAGVAAAINGGPTPTLSVVPERAMAEYMTWIYTTEAKVFFFARVPADDLPGLRPYFDQVVQSAVVP